MNQGKAANTGRGNLNIGNLEGHAQHEGEIGEVEVIWQGSAGEVEPSLVLSMRVSIPVGIGIIQVRITKCKNRVNQAPGRKYCCRSQQDVIGQPSFGGIRCLLQ